MLSKFEAVKAFLRHTIGILAVGYYLVFSIGFSLNFHYCHGELSEISMSWQDSSCGCDNVGFKSCCQDIGNYYRISTDHVVSRTTPDLQPVVAPKPVVATFEPITVRNQFVLPALPLEEFRDVPIYLEVQSLIYYG